MRLLFLFTFPFLTACDLVLPTSPTEVTVLVGQEALQETGDVTVDGGDNSGGDGGDGGEGGDSNSDSESESEDS